VFKRLPAETWNGTPP